ncbi:MAG TPA: hypothetical protein VN154_00480 [Rhizomicrobium sp.]|nr:hypothetical protein [Rhizomicrobium sp.]
MKKTLMTTAATALLGLGALALTTGNAGAYVACNETGDCWHTDHREHYRDVHVEWHPDNWYWHHDWDNDRDHHWHHSHDGHGYWKGGVWINL